MDSRTITYSILIQFERKDTKIPVIRDAIYAKHTLNNSSKQRATFLVNEVIRLRGRLDLMITFISSKKINHLGKTILTILRIGFYEIIYDPKIPDYAAVDSSVDLAHKFSNRKSAGFTNAVLRNLVRKKNKSKNWYEKLKLHRNWFSLPIWIQERWLKHYGEKDFFNLVDFINQPSKTYIRCDSKTNSMAQNIHLLEKSGIKSELYIKNFLTVESSNSKILDSELFKEGDISIQSPSAAAIVDCLDADVGDVILDVCAAPGTKSLFMAQRVGQGGKIFACDNSQTRIDKALKDKSRHRLNNIEWHLLDASKDKYPLHEKILLDVPCSGTGVIGRRPDIKWRLRKSDIRRMANLQKSILKNISNYLKPGGKLIYSTCSLEREENQDVIDHFLKNRSDFELIGTNSLLPDRWVNSGGFMFSFPAKTNTDGLFAAVLRKKI